MPLTPTDVANKQFRIAFRGYSLDEVDAFLDEVETELSRLLRDNAGLKDRPGAPAPAADVPAAAPAPAPLPLQGMQGQEAALRTLLLAQRTADEAIAEARAEAEEIVLAARKDAQSARDAAESEAAATLGSSRTEAERALGSARAEADSTLQAAQAKASRVDQDVASRIQAATGGLDEKRRALEVRIEELRAFEREYRTRLKAYLETQLRDLDSKQGADDGGAGVPAGARTAAVGLTPGAAAGVRPRTAGPEAAPAPTPAPTPAADDQASADGPGQDDTDGAAPAGPPREAGPTGPRAVPPLVVSRPEPVGPFAPRPATGPGERA